MLRLARATALPGMLPVYCRTAGERHGATAHFEGVQFRFRNSPGARFAVSRDAGSTSEPRFG